ncbi:hypothetical protein AAGU66_09395 [Edwardsiella ictaluri]|uniref:Uncharacterized protein n=2 Tax=Edwardsiella ictaluri TaxID=67780 RepID=C5BFQ3_EDWI9|nr:hypothetical protein [Edwardsiella ictaluri]ACR69330.1 hypothetical protein NT01EI_2155 [Edwardsiella ictaluri 93-146]EKS7764673.1 hypothetical protein [Edwardsiella ictaluri]EKS7771761.1 hypothetical protein [Edwardsiella ictaluri]EKS7774662.1 hypothetical protein [Edwardsiella ictaluri]EKS7777961.1 hypothetical protein [Edwardsiella ictaluri]
MNSRRLQVARCVAKYALACHSARRWNTAMKMLKASLGDVKTHRLHG